MTFKGTLFGLTAVLMWAAYMAYARAGVVAGLDALDFVVLRFGVAGIMMLPFVLLRGPRDLTGVGWRRGGVLAIFAGPLFVALGAGGYIYAPLSHGAVLQPSTVALVSLVLGWVLFSERITTARVIGTLVILGGIVLIATRSSGGAAGAGSWIGDVMFVSAGLLWVGFTVLLKRWRIGAVQGTAAVSVISGAVVLAICLSFYDIGRLLALPPGMLAIQIVVQGVFSGVLALICFVRAVELLGAASAALFPALVPAATLIVGIPVTGTMPGPLEWLGAAMATAGLVIALGALRFPRGLLSRRYRP